MMLWVWIGLMIVVGIALVLIPMLRAKPLPSSAPARDQLNISVHRQQLTELETEHLAGNLSDQQFQQAKDELERDLLVDLDTSALPDTSNKVQSWVVTLLLILIPGLSLGLYDKMGSSAHLELFEQSRIASQQPQQNRQSGQVPSVDAMVLKLEQKLQEDPQNGEGWAMLARSYGVMKRYQEAAGAYERARQLLGDQPDLLANQAEVLALGEGGNLQGQAKVLILQALEKDSEHQKALWLAGFLASQAHQPEQAIAYWQRLLEKMPADEQGSRVVLSQIEKARAQLGGDATAMAKTAPAASSKPAPDDTQSSGSSSVNVSVKLDPGLASKALPSDTVFIFARAVNGPPMPLAIVRKQVKDLPITVNLNDGMAMMPAAKLSNFAQVYVGARVSKSGTAKAQSGDLQGRSAEIPSSIQELVEVTINQEVL